MVLLVNSSSKTVFYAVSTAVAIGFGTLLFYRYRGNAAEQPAAPSLAQRVSLLFRSIPIIGHVVNYFFQIKPSEKPPELPKCTDAEVKQIQDKFEQTANERTKFKEVIETAPVLVSSLPSIAFGAAQWKKYFGDVGFEPPLPKDIDQILSSSCPFWPSKKVHETHLLVLVPQTVGGQPLTLKTLGELVKKPLTGHATQYNRFYLGEYTGPAAPPSHWVLMTRDVIEGSCDKSYPDQQTLLSQKGQDGYAVPTILDATVCIFMEYVRSGTRLYSDSPWTYTRCQEKYDARRQLVVGGFASGGLYVVGDSFDYEDYGVGAGRKFH